MGKEIETNRVKIHLKSHRVLIETARIKVMSSNFRVQALTTGLRSLEANPVFEPSLSSPVYLIPFYLSMQLKNKK